MGAIITYYFTQDKVGKLQQKRLQDLPESVQQGVFVQPIGDCGFYNFCNCYCIDGRTRGMCYGYR